MLYKILADIVILIHFLWVIFIVFGGFSGRRHKAVKVIHISGICFALLLQIFSWYCPFTYLEIWLRAMHDPAFTYAGSFIIHYLEEIVYIQINRGILFLLTLSVAALNIWLYLGKEKSTKI